MRHEDERRASPRPLTAADLSRVSAIFTDVDGTLTTGGVIESRTLRQLEWLQAAGIPVVLVSGRPSGFGECWMRTLPVAGAIVENGGLFYWRTGDRIRKSYARPPAVRKADRVRLRRAVAAALKAVPGARLSTDSIAREVDLAIDWHEQAALDGAWVDRIEEVLHRRGIRAVRSSVHVNAWVGGFDKLSAIRSFCARVFCLGLRRRDPRVVYVGDSFNDAPAFGGVSLSVGVANVRAVLDEIESAPAFVTRRSEGAGFREVAAAVLRSTEKRELRP